MADVAGSSKYGCIEDFERIAHIITGGEVMNVIQLYVKVRDDLEYCFNVGFEGSLVAENMIKLRTILSEGFVLETISMTPHFSGANVVEVGPRMNFATSWSSNMVSICHAVGLSMITRVERSRCYVVPDGADVQEFIDAHHDRMTECYYPEPLTTFDIGIEPEVVHEVDMKNGGPDALKTIPGISMDEWDRNLYYTYFVEKCGRNPTIVEIMDLNNANSEHSRHGFFKGIQIIDGEEQGGTLFDLITDTLDANPSGSLVAFKDNSSVIAGHEICTIVPWHPDGASPFHPVIVKYNPLLTAETHNFPTGVAPFPGAETGTGGRIRDVQGTGKGGFVIAGTAGYCVSNLFIPGYELPWEKESERPDNLASALQIEIGASDGASDYGNKFGEPVIAGFTRSFDIRLSDGERWGFLKPIMFTGGIGQIDDRHLEKSDAEEGMLIVQVGGPAYRVGFGGGAASSMLQGENISDLDFDAVQRGDAEMEQKMNRVIRACNEMGDRTLIDVIHDQGAGGPANVLKELVEKTGGRINIRNIRVGDPTMSVVEIYVAEYQERNGFLIRPENIERFEEICKREKVGCEVLGEVTGDLRFVVHDAQDNSTPVDFELDKLLGDMPQKTFRDDRIDPSLPALVLSGDLKFRDALHDVLRLLSVGSKRFLTNKVDRAVTGLVAQQQCVGPLQLPLANVAVVAQSHFGPTGIASSIGEQSIKMLVDPAAGARMAVAEMLTNLMWAGGIDLEQVKCSANWMWAPKLSGEGAAIWDAATAMRDVMIALGIAVDGGKDSLSMATMVGDEVVKSPRELVISGYAAVPDITKVVTPDIKHPGESQLIFIDLSGGKNRLGGSALAQVNGQIGNESPDVDNPENVKKAFKLVQSLIDIGYISAGHDRSDGGLITTLLEMAFSGNCGLDIELENDDDPLETLFSEEIGVVVECQQDYLDQVVNLIKGEGLACQVVGKTKISQQIRIRHNGTEVLLEDMRTLRCWWEETSYQLECLQANPECADAEKASIYDRTGPEYVVPFDVQAPDPTLWDLPKRPKVAILRDEGSNSDREMTSAFYMAGFEPWDITMTDLIDGRIGLSKFRGLAAVGGFSYADVPESAKGWAATILFNERLKTMFDEFYNRADTFTFGVCNGCQLFGLLGWVPWRNIPRAKQPRFVRNTSGRFESRWSTVKVGASPAIMLKGMERLIFGIHVDHGEGRLHFPDDSIASDIIQSGLAPICYVDDDGEKTEKYPFNPNGSPLGIAGLCSPDGRHLAMMPHPERVFLPWQAHWLPEGMKEDLQAIGVSPWMKMFQNAYEWCMQNQ